MTFPVVVIGMSAMKAASRELGFRITAAKVAIGLTTDFD